jgi:hypothetical protein
VLCGTRPQHNRPAPHRTAPQADGRSAAQCSALPPHRPKRACGGLHGGYRTLNIDPSNAWQAWMRLHAVCVGAQWCVGGNHLRGGVRGHEALVLRRGALLEVAARTPCIMPVLRTPFGLPCSARVGADRRQATVATRGASPDLRQTWGARTRASTPTHTTTHICSRTRRNPRVHRHTHTQAHAHAARITP